MAGNFEATFYRCVLDGPDPAAIQTLVVEREGERLLVRMADRRSRWFVRDDSWLARLTDDGWATTPALAYDLAAVTLEAQRAQIETSLAAIDAARNKALASA